MSPNAIHAAVFPLRMIFWGGLLCIFDFTFSSTTNGEGFKFDILNDAVGMFMIAWGVFQLRNIPVNPRYASAMGFVAVISVLGVLDAVRAHFILRLPEIMVFALNVFSLVCLGAIVVFCLAMRWFCEEAGLWDAVASWRRRLGWKDIAGNVREWCEKGRVLRGGSCLNYARFVRASDRFDCRPVDRHLLIGFRLART